MSKRYTILTAAMCACLIASNIFETKIFNAGPVTLTGGFLVFPIAYIINDIMSELYGYKQTRFAVYLSFIINAAFVLTAQIVRILPPETFWDGQDHFDYIFTANLRITIASMAAYVFGSLLNARIMSYMKSLHGTSRFGLRAILSTLAGETTDSLIFFPIAFYGVGIQNLIAMMLVQILLKTLYELLVLPLTSRYIARHR